MSAMARIDDGRIGCGAIAGHPLANMHKFSAVGQWQTAAVASAVKHITVSDLITFMRHIEGHDG
jgi:hypothetical protein